MNKSIKVDKRKMHIAIILDRSSSMSSIRDATVCALNKQIETLHKEASNEIETFVSLVTFSEQIDHPAFLNLPLCKLKRITSKHYEPNGGTALNDAIGTTILRIFNLPKEDLFLVIVVTDGQENSSELLKDNGVKNLTNMLSNNGNWTFVYLAANNTKEHFIENYGASSGNVNLFDATDDGMLTAGNQMSKGITNYLSAVNSGESSVDGFWN